MNRYNILYILMTSTLAKIYDHVTGKQEYLLDILNSIQVHGTMELFISILNY